MLRIYETLPTYVGEIKKRFNKEFCEGNLSDSEYAELNSMYTRMDELANKCKSRRKQGGKNDGKASS